MSRDPSQQPEYLSPTPYIESVHPAVRAFAAEAAAGAGSARERAVALYYAVRDGVRYDPWVFSFDRELYRASRTLQTRRSFCVPKAILLAAAARSLGVAARLGFADVRNHLASDRLLAVMKTDVFVFHGYVEMWLGGRWVKATPSFDLGLCHKFGVEPLQFDGVQDALLHPFDREGKRHMEYLKDHGQFADLPIERLERATRRAYPHLIDAAGRPAGWDRGEDEPAHPEPRTAPVSG